MKKGLSIFLSIVMIITMLGVPVSAENTPTVTVQSIEKAAVIGETVELNVSVANNPGFTNFDLAVEYDTERLELKDFATFYEKDLGDGEIYEIDYLKKFLVEYNINTGKISATASGTTVYTKNDVIFRLVFKVKENAPSGKATVSINKKTANIKNTGTPVKFEYVAGAVNVDGIDCDEGHDWGQWQTRTEPTCEEDGEAYRVCKRIGCGKEETKPIPTDGHKYGDCTFVDEFNHKYVCEKDSKHIELEEHNLVDGYCEACGYQEPADDTTGGSTTGGSTTGGSTTGGSTTGGSTTGGSTTGGSTTGGSTTGGSTTGGSTTGGSTTGGSTTGGSTTGGSTTGGSTTGGSTTGGSTTGGSTTGGSTTGGSTTGGSTTGGSTTGGSTTGGSTTGGSTTGGSTTGGSTTGGSTTGGSTTGGSTTGGSTTGGSTTGGSTTGGSTTGGSTTGGSTTGGSTTGGSTTGGSTTGGSTTGGSTTGGSTTGGSTTGGSTTGGSTTGGSTTGGSTTGGSTTGGCETGHSFGEWEELDENEHKRVCVCGETETAPHNWDNGVVTTPATHTTTGVKTFTCTDCQATKTETIEKTAGHSFGEWEELDENDHKRVCACNEVETAPHNWDNGVVTTPATHTTTGVKTFTCTDCQATKTETIEKTAGHSFGKWTKANENEHKRVCACNEVETAPHNWNAGTVTTPATHTTTGVKTFTCTDCQATKTETIEKTPGHSFGEWEELDENDHKRVCECNEVETAPHNWDNGVVTTPATHTTTGVKTFTCTDCQATKTETIEKTAGHSFGEWAQDDEKNHKRVCECNEFELEEHKFDSFDNQQCTVCGYIRIAEEDGVVIEAKQNGSSISISSIKVPAGYKGSVVINMAGYADSNVDSVQIDMSILDSLDGNDLEIVMIDSSRIVLNAEAVEEIKNKVGNGTVSIKVVKLADGDLTSAQLNAVGTLDDYVVYRVSIVNDNTGEEITNLNVGSIVVNVGYNTTVRGAIMANALADDGTMTDISSQYNSTTATATLNIDDLGEYVIYTIARKGSSGGSSGYSSISYVVKFKTNCDESVASQTIKSGGLVKMPEELEKDGYTFEGWYLDEKLTKLYDFETPVKSNFTLYAKWTEVEEEPVEKELPFADVKQNSWFYDAVQFAYENGIVKGVTATAFAPNNLVTRAEFVTMLYRMEGEPEANESVPYVDVKANAYYAEAISWAHHNGIVKGISDTEFAPNWNITREQVCTIIYRYVNYKGRDISAGDNVDLSVYTDGHTVSEYAVSAIKFAVGSSIMKGKTDSTLNPKDNTTRAELTQILYNFLK